VEANLVEHRRLVELAASHGAHVVVFPELSLTGYELELAEELAMSKDDPRLSTLADAAVAHSLTIIAGAPVRNGRALHIGAFIVSPERTMSLYTKQHLGAFGESARRDGRVPPPEASVFEPGELDPLVPFAGGPGAVAICADIGRASHPKRAAERGAKAYLASMFVIPSDFDGDSSRLCRYAAEHSMLVAFSNFGSPTGGLASAGRSSIWSEQGELLVELPSSGSGVAVATRSSKGWRATAAADQGHGP
jgi:predicted amidohydrolase